jgi:hypothetical protein
MLSVLALVAVWGAENYGGSCVVGTIEAENITAAQLGGSGFSINKGICQDGLALTPSALFQRARLLNVTCSSSARLGTVLDFDSRDSTAFKFVGSELECSALQADLVVLDKGVMCAKLVGWNATLRDFQVTGLNISFEGARIESAKRYFRSGDNHYIRKYLVLQVLGACVGGWLTVVVTLFTTRRLQMHHLTAVFTIISLVLGLNFARRLPGGAQATDPTAHLDSLHALHAFWTNILFYTLVGFLFRAWQDFIARLEFS